MIEAGLQRIGVVVIGRNEGERLERCLASLDARVAAVVYVDSASVDDSVELARGMMAEVVQLDDAKALTAARSRNAGITKLLNIAPHVEFVQVVDGDCEVVKGWLERAVGEIRRDPRIAVVCGRRHERSPQSSTYNRLIDMEWNTPIGEASACGGDALIRIKAFQEIGGYDESIIAGEEPEMCLRLRVAGWSIRRIDASMTLHDANMKRFGQWWKRMVRSGHAYAEGNAMHGRRHRFNGREVRSILAWGLALPVVAVGLAVPTYGAGAGLLLGYGALWHRVRGHRTRHGDSRRDASFYATFCVLGKFPQLIGVAKYWFNRLLGRRTRLIEYKGNPAAQARHA